jgi:hypothetical protein
MSFQVPRIVQVPEEYEVDKTITVPKVVQEEREIRIPVQRMVKKTVKVPKQRVVTEMEEVSLHGVIPFLCFSLLLILVFSRIQHTVTVQAMEEATGNQASATTYQTQPGNFAGSFFHAAPTTAATNTYQPYAQNTAGPR